jgi:hypothetical protein
MIKGWLSQIAAKLRELAGEECRRIDFPIGVEVDAGNEAVGWVLRLDQNKVTARSKADEAKITFYVPQNHLRALSINLRTKYWREAFAAGNVKIHAEDGSLAEKLQPLVQAVEKREAGG